MPPTVTAGRGIAAAVVVAAGLTALAAVAITFARLYAPAVDAAARRPLRRGALQQLSGTTCITPDRDAAVDSERPTETLGAQFFLHVARGRAVPPTQRWSYMHFATSTLPNGIELVSASLRLIVEDTTGIPPFSQSVHAVTSGWDEPAITWNNRPRVTGALVNTAFGGQAMTVTADVTLLLRNWLDGTWPNHGLALEPDADFDAVWFYSREYNDPPHPPLLCVEWRRPTATPGPTATPIPTDTTVPRASATSTPSPTPTASDTRPAATPSFTPTSTGTPRGPSVTPTDPAASTATPTPSRTTAPSRTPTHTPSPTRTGPAVATPTEDHSSLDLLVTDAGDEPDAQPGDGFCRTLVRRCTLRAALGEADKNGAADVRITFDPAVATIAVSAALPLPPIRRNNVGLDGTRTTSAVDARGAGEARRTDTGPPGHARAAVSVGAPDASLQAASIVRIVAAGGSLPSSVPGLVVDGARGVVIDSLAFEGFAVGIAVLNRSTGVAIGAGGAGSHGNRLVRNGVGLAVDATTTDVLVQRNAFERNRDFGVLLGRSAGGRIQLIGNRMANNGSAAIGVSPAGAETAPPVISAVDGRIGIVSGTACPGCVIEVFADPGVQAARVLAATATADAGGRWSVRGLVFLPADVNVTATATQLGSTSRLSAAFPTAAGVAWTLSERPGASPGPLRERVLVRRYVLRDERRLPVPAAILRFVDDDLGLTFPVRNGVVDVSLSVDLAAALFSRKLHTSLEAVEIGSGGAGERHSVRWAPNLAVAVAQPGAGRGDVLLDILGLGPLGLGARHRLDTADTAMDLGIRSMALDARLASHTAWERSADAPVAVADLAQAGAYAAAYVGAPPELREGPYAWTQNMAMGGGIYELQSGGEAVSGPLEIVAPVAAYNAAGPASGCPGAAIGAVVCGWLEMGRCWVPVPGSSADAPSPGASTFVASANVSLPAGGAAASLAQTIEPLTIYTVGFDVVPPVYTATLTNGMRIIGHLPPDLGAATDDRSGVNAESGIVATLGNHKIPLRYDPDRRRIVVTDRTIPLDLPDGQAELAIRITDGFCNATTASFDVDVVRGSSIVLPYGCKKCSLR